MGPGVAVFHIAQVIVNAGLVVVEIFPRHAGSLYILMPPFKAMIPRYVGVFLSVPWEVVAEEHPLRRPATSRFCVEIKTIMTEFLLHVADPQAQHATELRFPLGGHSGKVLTLRW